jgi:hypothetical protein
MPSCTPVPSSSDWPAIDGAMAGHDEREQQRRREHHAPRRGCRRHAPLPQGTDGGHEQRRDQDRDDDRQHDDPEVAQQVEHPEDHRRDGEQAPGCRSARPQPAREGIAARASRGPHTGASNVAIRTLRHLLSP